MGGFFGAVTNDSAISDVFFGTDYHSHLGTRRGGMAAYDREIGLQRDIHNIENSPFRTKFERVFEEMFGTDNARHLATIYLEKNAEGKYVIYGKTVQSDTFSRSDMLENWANEYT